MGFVKVNRRSAFESTNEDQVLSQKRKPDLFIFHISTDKPKVVQIAVDLAFLGVDAWLEPLEFESSDQIHIAISESLNSSRYTVVAISQSLIKLHWCFKEMSKVMTQEISNGDNRVMLILIEDVAPPTYLSDRMYIHLDKDYWCNIVRLASHIHDISVKRIEHAFNDFKPKNPTTAYALMRKIGWSGELIVGRDELNTWLRHLHVDTLSKDSNAYQFNRDEIETFSRIDIFKKIYQIEDSPEREIGRILNITVNDIRFSIISVLRSQLGKPDLSIHEDATFNELGIDSFLWVECIDQMERKIGLTKIFSVEDTNIYTTIGELIENICNRLGIN